MKKERLTSLVQRQSAAAELFVDRNGEQLIQLASDLVQRLQIGGRLVLVGYGPFQGVAQYLAHIFLYGVKIERPRLPALYLAGSGGDPEGGLPAQLISVVQENDCLLLFEDSRQQERTLPLLSAIRNAQCRQAVATTRPDELISTVDVVFEFPFSDPAVQMENALFLAHGLCAFVEAELFGF